MGGSISRILSYPHKRVRQPLIWISIYMAILAFYPKSFIRDELADNHALLLEIAPVGVYPLDQLPDPSVSSYLTISPLLIYVRFQPAAVRIYDEQAQFQGLPRRNSMIAVARMERRRAVSFLRHFPSLHKVESHAPNMGNLSCGVRTFLPANAR